jgi:hypothetical protein
MSAISIPGLWIPRRRPLWTPWSELFTAGKAQRKSDGKLPRKTSTGTAGKTPRNTTGTTCCCATSGGGCVCPSGGNYQSTFLVTVDGGISIPTGVCISISGTIVQFTSYPVAGATFCIDYGGSGIVPCSYLRSVPSFGSYSTSSCAGTGSTDVNPIVVDPAPGLP